MTGAAETLRIRISTGPHDSRPEMEQFVIGAILADDEVAVRVVRNVLINVMHINAIRKIPSECRFRDEHMLANTTAG